MRVRVLRTTIAAALVVVSGGAAASTAGHAASTGPCNGNTALAGGGWVASKVPQLSQVADVVGVTYAPDRIYATDGRSTLVRSDDGGCHWTTISPSPQSLGGIGVGSEALRIAAISAPSSSTVQSYVYVGVNVSLTDQLPVALPSQPYVYSSAFAGKPFTASNNGLPTVGTITQVAASGTTPRDVYAVITGAGQQSGVYFSGDGGSTWEQRGADSALTHLQVSPAAPNDLFALAAGGVVASLDGGRSFQPIAHTDSGVTSYSVTSGSGSVQMAQGRRGSHRLDLSIDGGNHWKSYDAPEQTEQVALTTVLPLAAVADAMHVSVVGPHGPSLSSYDVTPNLGAPRDLFVSAPGPDGLALLGVDPTHRVVLRAAYNPFTHHASASLTPVLLLPQVTVKQFPSTLRAGARAVHLAPGAHRDVRYQLLLPRTPSPVDLMFLVDSTDSEASTIDGVRQALQSIVNDMNGSGLDVAFGLADFKDYPYLWGGNGDDTDYPYKLRARIGASTAELAKVLGALRASGGSDIPETDLTALYQSTTGAGQKIGHRYVIPPGQGADYRAGSLRLALVATDAPFHQERDYPTPSWSSVVAALRAADVHEVGLAVQGTDAQGQPVPRQFRGERDERRMAAATGGIAPAGGADCDGNGTTDVAGGAPLVCRIPVPRTCVNTTTPLRDSDTCQLQRQTGLSHPPRLHLGPVVSELAQSLPEFRTVTLRVNGAPAGQGRVVSAPAAPQVNLHVDNNLGFVVRYSCPTRTKPATWPVTVTATAGTRVVASSPMTLTCGAVPPPKPATNVVPPALAAAAVAAPAPPNPPSNVNGNTNPNPALNPNAGFATQDEQQPQVALADADQGATEESLAMSRRSSDREAAWMLGAASLMTAAAAGYATRTRWRVSRQRI